MLSFLQVPYFDSVDELQQHVCMVLRCEMCVQGRH